MAKVKKFFSAEYRARISAGNKGKTRTKAQRLARSRAMLGKPRPRKFNVVKYNALIFPEPNTGCWLWAGAVNNKGYGMLQYGGESKAHRVFYKLYNTLPEGAHVLHHCDVRSCVNPDHLYAGTNQDNVNDRTKRNRWRL